MSPTALNCFIQLAIGFAIAGALASAYQTVASRPPSFALLQQGPTPKSFAAVPLLVFSAPVIIMRNTLRSGAPDPQRIQFVMTATVLAGFWSLMSGTFVILTLQALGIIAGA